MDIFALQTDTNHILLNLGIIFQFRAFFVGQELVRKRLFQVDFSPQY